MLLMAVLALAGSTVWLGVIGKDGAGTTAALCFGLCFFLFLYRFKRIKGLGFEGELWEQEMEKAAELRLALKDLSERMGESVYWDLGEGSRMGKPDPNKIFGIIERTDQNLSAAGIERAKIEELKRPWHKCIMRDLANPITKRLGTLATEKAEEVTAEIAALGNPIPEDRMPEHNALIERQAEMHGFGKQLSDLIWRGEDYENVPRRLRETIDGTNWLTADDRQTAYTDCAEEFRDIDQYANDRTIRRRNVLGL